MFHVVLFEPEIPPNTGNIIRLCANTGTFLHLIQPLGFSMDEKSLRRAGLDYAEYVDVQQHASLEIFLKSIKPPRLFAYSTKGHSDHTSVKYQAGDALLFGPETRGLPAKILEDTDQDSILRLPMKGTSRSLNLSNTVAVVVYEAWRQTGFELL